MCCSLSAFQLPVSLPDILTSTITAATSTKDFLIIMNCTTNFVMWVKVTLSNLSLPLLLPIISLFLHLSLDSGQPYWLRQARLTDKCCWSKKEEIEGWDGACVIGVQSIRRGGKDWGGGSKGKLRRKRESGIKTETLLQRHSVFKVLRWLCGLSNMELRWSLQEPTETMKKEWWSIM